MDEEHIHQLRLQALQTMRSKPHTHVTSMSSTQSALPHPMTAVTVNPLLQGVPLATASHLANSLSLQGNMQMAAIPAMGMASRAGMNPAQLPPPPPPPGPPPAKQGSISQGMNAMPYSVLGKLPTVTVTMSGYAQASQTPAGYAQASQTPAGYAQASQTPAGYAQASQTPAGFAQASQTPAGFAQASQTPAGFAQASQSRHSLYQLQGMQPTASPASLFSMNPVKKPQKTKARSRTPEHSPEDRTPRRSEAHFYKRSRSRSSYSRSASRSRSPRRRSRSSTYSRSRSSSYSTSASNYSSSSSSSETDSSRSPSPVRKGRRKGRSHHRKDKEKSSSRRKEKEKERRRRKEKKKWKRRRERSPAELSEQSTPDPGYRNRSLYDSSVKDYSSPSKRPRSDLPRSGRDRHVDYGPSRSLPSHPPSLQGEYSPLLRLSGRLSPRPPRRHASPADRIHSRMRRDDPHLQMRDQYPDKQFDLNYLPAEEYSPSPSRYRRRMSPPTGGSGRDQNSPRRYHPRVGGGAERGRDGRGDLRRVGQDGRGNLRGADSDGWDHDFERTENRWSDIRNEGRRPDIRSERRRLDARSEGRRPDIRTEGRRADFGGDSRRMDFRSEGRQAEVRREDRHLETRSDERHREVRGEGRRLEMRSEESRLDARTEGRRAEIKSEGRRPVVRNRHLTSRQGEADERHSRRHNQQPRDSRQDDRLRDVPLREKGSEKKTKSARVSVSEEEPPEGHSGHSHGEESVTDDDAGGDAHSDAESSGGGEGEKVEDREEEEEEEEEGVVQSSEEEEKQGEEKKEDSQEQSSTLGWGEDVIELAYDDEFGEEDLQQEQKQPSSVSTSRRRSSSVSGGREEEKERAKGKKRISSPIRVSPTPEELYLSRHYSGSGDHNRHHWRQSELPPSLANRLGPKEFRGLKSRTRGTRVGIGGVTSKGSADEIARRHRVLKEHHGGEGGQEHRRRNDRRMR